jgi:hypothetical protein
MGEERRKEEARKGPPVVCRSEKSEFRSQKSEGRKAGNGLDGAV